MATRTRRHVETGRHRRGLPHRAVHRRAWDQTERAWAAHLDVLEPAWAVLYGPWSREYFAFAAWPTPRPLIVEAATPEGLRELMRAAELPQLRGAAP